MKRISRTGSVAALTAVIAFGVSGQAFAAGADDIRFDLTSAVSPNKLKPDKFKPASLYTQTTWLDQDNNPVVPEFGAEEVRIDFDDDSKIKTRKLAKCQTPPAELATMTTPEAIDSCSKSVVGSGIAKVRFGGFPDPPFESRELDLTVTAFNGPKSVVGPANCDASNLGGPANCEWIGDNKTLYLHARNNGLNQTSLVQGEIQKKGQGALPGTGTPPIGVGLAHRLAVTDGTDVAGDAGAVTLFNAVVSNKNKFRAGGKKRTNHYIMARCNPNEDVEPLVDGIQTGFKYEAHVVYDDDSSHGGAGNSEDTDVLTQYCHV